MVDQCCRVLLFMALSLGSVAFAQVQPYMKIITAAR
jgi:hypothetical protein